MIPMPPLHINQPFVSTLQQLQRCLQLINTRVRIEDLDRGMVLYPRDQPNNIISCEGIHKMKLALLRLVENQG